MQMELQPPEQTTGPISHYSLTHLRKGEQHFYIWRHQLPPQCAGTKHAVLINLKNIYVPDSEIDKLVFSFEENDADVRALAFAGCHAHNQRQIKRKLKAHNVRLFSHAAFFHDIQKAEQWLAAQLLNC